ncbi:MAG TPA: SulP family inorganic anion transporter [Chitinophagaceae bacterium]|nr:SulP family inorganic anion transporter [Chitinophagaceae bacterium]
MRSKFTIPALTDIIPITGWLPKYPMKFLGMDMIAGLTLASFVLPESMAYASLAGVPAYFGIYCCLAGALFFAFFTTSKQVAIGPTSSISLMIGATVAVLSGGDPGRWAAIAALTALMVGVLCVIAYLFKLSSLVNFISNSILLGFKAGAALSIMTTQLPKLFGVEGGGSNFFTRLAHLGTVIPDTNFTVLAFGLIAFLVLIAGDHFLPGKPVSLMVVIASILVMSFTDLASKGLHITGFIPAGLPDISKPSLRFSDVDGVLELAFACFLMGYIETISAARTFAMKHHYEVSPRQELLSMGFANIATAFFSGFVVAGGLSQSTVNDKSGAKTPMSLILCSVALAIILIFMTGLLQNLPHVVLAAIVIHAVMGLIKVKELKQLRQLSTFEFIIAMIALAGVLVFGILKGVMLAVVMSLLLLLRKTSNPRVAELGRIGNSEHFSDIKRHPENIVTDGLLILRIESSIMYFNAEHIHDDIFKKLAERKNIQLVILDLSSAPYVDVSGSKMLVDLTKKLKQKNIQLKVADALSEVRDLLRKQHMEEITGHISRSDSIDALASAFMK